MAPAVIGFLGVIVGAAASLAGTYLLERMRERRSYLSLAAALLAEIRAILHTEEIYGYRAIYQDALDRIKLNESVSMPNISYDSNPARSVYYTNLSSIGTLPADLSERIVKLSYVYEVVGNDRMCMDRGEWETQKATKRIDMLQKHLNAYDSFVALAKEVADMLEKVRR